MFPVFKQMFNSVVNISSGCYVYPLSRVITRSYAVESKKAGKAGSTSANTKKEFPVEKDPYKLVNYVCGSNIYKEGEDIKLKPESEYPDWLWTIRTGPSPKLHELDPNSKYYWIKVRTMARRQKNKLHRLKYKVLKQF